MKNEPNISSYRIITEGGTAEIVEKKSRFIGEVFPVHSPEEAAELIESAVKRTWDAKHHCYAFVTGPGRTTMRSSDNGEPSGTAGKPILEVINGAGLTDTLIIVTRYFGGILLGTGGLVRAYTQAAQAALAASTIGEMSLRVKLLLSFSYDMVNPVQQELARLGIPVSTQSYTDKVEYLILPPSDRQEEVVTSLTGTTNGRITITEKGTGYFASSL